MKKLYAPIFLCAVLLCPHISFAQDIPLFTQKLSNSFLYNPSIAGNGFGSFTFSYRQYWSGIEGSPSTSFLSLHTPLAKHKIGFGVNVFQDKLGVSKTLLGSAAVAYHIQITDESSFSMGVSAEYGSFKTTGADVIDTDDPLLLNGYNKNEIDFSFGLSYHAKYISAGIAANRLSSLTGIKDSTQFPAYYSAFLSGHLPVANERDRLEPMLSFRSLAPGSNQIDGGLYYTFKDFITLGGSYRTGGVVNATAALRIHRNILLGYSREMFTGEFGSRIGASNEFTLRIDFRDREFHSKVKNARQINTQALAIRRKTLVTYKSRGTALQKSNRYKKKVKKNYIHSPNYRMDSSRKLQTMKVSKNRNGYNKKNRYKRKRSRRRH